MTRRPRRNRAAQEEPTGPRMPRGVPQREARVAVAGAATRFPRGVRLDTEIMRCGATGTLAQGNTVRIVDG